jgi:5'-deoxynucleotidase YfbR-like HD superfamily hydrolase
MSIFLSYSHVDKALAIEIEKVLSDSGVPVFRDEKSIEWGESISRAVKSGLQNCTQLLVILSPASLKSQWVAFEMGSAVAQEKTILPYLTHPSIDIPQFLCDLSYITSVEELRKIYPPKYSSPKRQESGLGILDALEKLVEEKSDPVQRNILAAVSKLYALKGVKRIGWKIMGVNEIESVADHVYLTTLLATLFLPDSFEEYSEYRKGRVLELLILHDIDEAYVSDLAFTGTMTDPSQVEEAIAEDFKALSKFLVQDLTRVHEIREEMNAIATINAQIASDFDKLETFIQLRVSAIGNPFEDFEEKKRMIFQTIKTSLVCEIAKSIDYALSN